MIDFSAISDRLVLLDSGIWTTPDHKDLNFLSEDDTDWPHVEEGSFWYRHRNHCLTQILKRHPFHGTLFEIGAGNGSVSLAIQQQGLPVVAIEPTTRMAHQAKLRGVNHVINASLESGEFRKHSLANVALFDVLEHVADDELFLCQVRDLMPRGGVLYCAVPSYQFLWSCEDKAAGHFRRYRLKTLCRKLAQGGFVVNYATYLFSALVLPVFFVRALPSRLGVRSRRTPSSTEKEHRERDDFIGVVLKKLLNREWKGLSHGKRYHFGTSCAVVGRAV